MFASTNVLTASEPFAPVPSVAAVIGAEPLIDSVAEACAVTLPGVADENVIVHWPLGSVFAPAFVQDPLAVEWTAPLESVSVKLTCSPAAGTNVPVPCPSRASR